MVAGNGPSKRLELRLRYVSCDSNLICDGMIPERFLDERSRDVICVLRSHSMPDQEHQRGIEEESLETPLLMFQS